MGQIVSAAAKPKRCNLNQLSQVPTPAAGEYILVSSDNSMNSAGQGNFDCYIVGDGAKAATALELKSIAKNGIIEGSKDSVTGGAVYDGLNTINRDVFGNFTKELIWQNGYITTTGVIRNSTASKFTQPFLLKKGETVTIGTQNTNITIIGTTTADHLNINNTISVIQTTSGVDQFETYTYKAESDIKIVLCVLASNYTLDFTYDGSLLNIIEQVGNKLEAYISGEVSKTLTWSAGYFNSTYNDVRTSSASQFTQPFLLNKGEGINISTSGKRIVIGTTNLSSLRVGSPITPLVTIPSDGALFSFTYVAEEDIMVALSVTTADYELSFFLNDRTRALEAKIAKDSENIHAHNSQEEQNIVSLNKEWRGLNVTKRFTFAQITDSHEDSQITTQRLSEWANEYMDGEIHLLIHSGDVQYASWLDNQYVDFENIRKDSQIPFLLALGNHDQTRVPDGNELSKIYQRYIYPMVEQGLLSVGTNISANTTYYYYDNPSYKIRVIVLNDFDPMYDGFYSESAHSGNYYQKRYSPEQCQFFINTLNSVAADWTVIVVKHGNDPITKTDMNWTTSQINDSVIVDGDNIIFTSFVMSANPIMDIIDAYQRKTALSKTYTYTEETIAEHYPNGFALNADFSNSNGVFCAVIDGHLHADIIGHDMTYPNIKVVICANAGHFPHSPQMDVGRTREKGKAQDVFSVYSIDTEHRKLWITRVGANFTLDGKHRTTTSVNY